MSDENTQQNEEQKLIEDVEHAHPEIKLIQDVDEAHPEIEKLEPPKEE